MKKASLLIGILGVCLVMLSYTSPVLGIGLSEEINGIYKLPNYQVGLRMDILPKAKLETVLIQSGQPVVGVIAGLNNENIDERLIAADALLELSSNEIAYVINEIGADNLTSALFEFDEADSSERGRAAGYLALGIMDGSDLDHKPVYYEGPPLDSEDSESELYDGVLLKQNDNGKWGYQIETLDGDRVWLFTSYYKEDVKNEVKGLVAFDKSREFAAAAENVMDYLKSLAPADDDIYEKISSGFKKISNIKPLP